MIGEKRDHTPRIVSKWVPNPELWDLVKLAWKMRAEGRTYSDIQKATGGKIYRTINCWQTFFTNKTYLGIQKFGDLEVSNHHEPAVTLEMWEAVQKRMHAYPGGLGISHPRRNAYPSLLSGLATCMECGAAMVHHKGRENRKWAYYACGVRDLERGIEKSCKSRRVNARRADRVILDTILNRILTPAFLEELIEEAREQMNDTSSLDQEITLKQALLDNLDRGIQRLLDLVKSGEMDNNDAIVRLRQRQAERAHTKSEIRLVEARRDASKIEITPEAISLVLDMWRGQFAELMQTNDLRALRALLARFVTKVELGYERGRIWYTYPVDGNTSRNNSPDVGAQKRPPSGGFIFKPEPPLRG